ncbi:MAG: RNA methyltransferase, partial [Pyrinomonadaceae bacterium]
GVILTQDTADVFSPKGLRGAMGSSFRLPLWIGANFEAAIDWCRKNGIVTVATEATASTNHDDYAWTQPSALILGAEAQGLDPDELGAADAKVRIPMLEPVESLNVAVAAGIILYEARRQRS